jgi:MFS family permease
VPFSLFRNPVVTVGCLIGFLVGAAMFGALAFIPLFVQGAMGGTATDAGVLLTPFLLGWFVTAVAGGRLMLRVGYRKTVLAGLFVLVASFVALSTFGRTTSRGLLLADMALMGSGMGLVMFSLLVTIQTSVNRTQLGIATSINQFSRSMGQTVGVALMGTVMTISLGSHLEEIKTDSGLPEEEVARVVHNVSALVDPVGRAGLKPELLRAMESALAGALQNAFIAGAVITFLALIAGFRLPLNPLASRTDLVLEGEPQIPKTAAECERLLIAEMATIDPEHEPAAVETRD